MSKRKRKLEADLGAFMRQYRRKHGGFDPNDRQYDRELEEKIRRMRPEELDELLHGRTEDEDDAAESEPP